MKNQSVSDFVAATMDAVLKSVEHKSLFGTQYKVAEDLNDAKDKCSKCHEKSCKCDSSMADDQDAKKSKDSKDSSDADDQYAKKSKDSKDSSAADDQDAKKEKKDSSDADDSSEEKVSSAFDVAIDSLLTASAALDSVGLEKGSTLSLKLASLVVEAKKKEKDSKKSDKKDSKKSDKKDSKKSDSHSAKDKKSDSKSSSKDSKKSDSKSSSKDSKKSSKK